MAKSNSPHRAWCRSFRNSRAGNNFPSNESHCRILRTGGCRRCYDQFYLYGTKRYATGNIRPAQCTVNVNVQRYYVRTRHPIFSRSDSVIFRGKCRDSSLCPRFYGSASSRNADYLCIYRPQQHHESYRIP